MRKNEKKGKMKKTFMQTLYSCPLAPSIYYILDQGAAASTTQWVHTANHFPTLWSHIGNHTPVINSHAQNCF